MHTRRFGALITGMWLMGLVLVWFASSQSYTNVERFFTSPPQAVIKEVNDIGSIVARQILTFQAAEFARRLQEIWEAIQLGLCGALLAISILAPRRSRSVILAGILLTLIVALQSFNLTPLMHNLARSYDFLPAGAAGRERGSFAAMQIWYRALEILKTGLLLAVVVRLMYDFHDFGAFVLPWSIPPQKPKRRRPVSGEPAETKVEQTD